MKDILGKFKFKGKAAIVNAPKVIEEKFIDLGVKASLPEREPSENTVVFINDKKELLHFLNKQLKKIKPGSVLWFAYPKMSSALK